MENLRISMKTSNQSLHAMYENRQNKSFDVPFYFLEVTVQSVNRYYGTVSLQKQQSIDNTPPKLLKVADKEVAEPIASPMNKFVNISLPK